MDGTKSMSGVQTALLGWKYENCDAAYPALLGRAFGARVGNASFSASEV